MVPWHFWKKPSQDEVIESKVSDAIAAETKHLSELTIITQHLQNIQKAVSIWQISNLDSKEYLKRIPAIRDGFEALEKIWERYEKSGDKKIQLMRNLLDDILLSAAKIRDAKSAAEIAQHQKALRNYMGAFGDEVNTLLSVCAHVSMANREALKELQASDKDLRESVNFLRGN